MAILYFIPALRIILGILFIFTASLKFPNLKGFAVIVASYNALPRWMVKPAAYSLPFIEFIVGWWILSGKALLYSALAGLALMIIATLFVLKGLLQSKKMENCGCYGTSISVPLTWKKFIENVVWIILFVILIFAVRQALALGIM
jgi:hypothetical protein